MKWRLAVALVLGVIPGLALSAGAAAAPPFPEIKRASGLSCSGARAQLAVAINWQKANRNGKHRGHAVGLIIGQNGRIHRREVSSTRLRSARSQATKHRFRFPKRASRRLCRGNAHAEVVSSHAHNRDGSGRVEIHWVTRRKLGAAASASVWTAGQVGSDCNQGGATASIKEGAQLQACNLAGVVLLDPDLDRADLSGASLVSADAGSGHFVAANLANANLTSAELAGSDFTNADLDATNLTNADLTFAFLTGAAFPGTTILTGANCSGATKADGTTVYSVGSFVAC